MYTRIVTLLLGLAGWLASPSSLYSQELEPRSYINIPKNMNFVLAGGAYQEGDMLLDPSLNVDDAVMRAKHVVYGYLRSFGIAGKAAKFAVGGTYTDFSGSGLLDGEPVSRDTEGFGDPAFKLTVNLLGAPALSAKEFGQYKQDTIFGVSLGVSAPWGEYDDTKAINIGFNRWTIRPELGVSKMFNRWIVEGSAAVAFYTDNTSFNNGKTREQDPLYSAQFHVIYRIRPGKGMWIALDATYYKGGRTETDGVDNDNALSNSRYGATFAMPVNRRNSLKFYVSDGANARRGTHFIMGGMAWQYRWGGGI